MSVDTVLVVVVVRLWVSLLLAHLQHLHFEAAVDVSSVLLPFDLHVAHGVVVDAHLAHEVVPVAMIAIINGVCRYVFG